MVASTAACPRRPAPVTRSRLVHRQGRRYEGLPVHDHGSGGHHPVRPLVGELVHGVVRLGRRIQRAAQKVRYGSKASRPADPTRAGHTFQGWYTSRDGGSKYDFGTAVTGDVTLHAHWAKEPAALRRLSGATRYDTMERIVGAGGWRSGAP